MYKLFKMHNGLEYEQRLREGSQARCCGGRRNVPSPESPMWTGSESLSTNARSLQCTSLEEGRESVHIFRV